ncbi:MAG: NAD(P)-binding protein [Nitrospiria bacterium]
MMQNMPYDAVFIGTGLLSLSAAAALTKKGKSVLVLDTTDLLKSTVPDPSFYFTLGPHLFFGFEKGGAMEGFFSELALPIPNLKNDGLIYQKSIPSLQIVQPSHRVNVYPEKEDYYDELKREFGKQLLQIKSFLREIEGIDLFFYPFLGRFSQLELHGVGDRLNEWTQRRDFLKAVHRHQTKSAPDLLEPFLFDKDFLEYLNLHALFAYKRHLSDISAYELILLISGLLRGAARMIGGCPTLIDFLQKLIKGWNGEVIQEKRITKVEMRGKRVVDGLRLDDGSLITGRTFIVSQFPSRPAVHFYYHIRGDLIPSPMRENLIMTWGKDPPKDFEDILILRLSLPEEEEAFPEGLRGLAVTAVLRPDTQIDQSRTEEIGGRILDRLQWLIPFSESVIREVGGARLHHGVGTAESRLVPLDMRRHWEANAKSVSMGALNYLQPREVKNVFLLPPDTSDTIGWGASFLGAMRLADLIVASK